MRRPAIFALLIMLTGIGLYAWLEFNRGHASTSEQQVDFTLSAEELYSAYENDEQKAEETYTGKIIELVGKVEKIESPTESIVNVLLNSGDAKMGGVLCNFEKLSPAELSQLHVGQTIKIRGACAGFLMDVSLLRCILIKSWVLFPNPSSRKSKL